MFDTIDSVQVKCFDCNLNHYKIGDTVPCEKYTYQPNLLILPFDSFIDDSWAQEDFILVNDSKVVSLTSASALTQEDFELIDEVISYQGTKLNIHSYDELFEYIEDLFMMKIKEDIAKAKYPSSYYEFDYYEPLVEKWHIIKKDIRNNIANT